MKPDFSGITTKQLADLILTNKSLVQQHMRDLAVLQRSGVAMRKEHKRRKRDELAAD